MTWEVHCTDDDKCWHEVYGLRCRGNCTMKDHNFVTHWRLQDRTENSVRFLKDSSAPQDAEWFREIAAKLNAESLPIGREITNWHGCADDCPDNFREPSTSEPRSASDVASEVYRPQRNDAVAQWLKQWRDLYKPSSDPHSHLRISAIEAYRRTVYTALDGLLDEYRLHADTGTSLDQEVTEG